MDKKKKLEKLDDGTMVIITLNILWITYVAHIAVGMISAKSLMRIGIWGSIATFIMYSILRMMVMSKECD